MRSLFEIDRQEARHQRCSEKQHLADSLLGGRSWCSLARNYGHLVHSTPPYSAKRWQTLKQLLPNGYMNRSLRAVGVGLQIWVWQVVLEKTCAGFVGSWGWIIVQ